MEAPTIGRTVHYVAYGTPNGEFLPEHRAAIVTEVASPVAPDTVSDGQRGVVGLCVLNPTGMFFNREVLFDPNAAPGTWHWPERV